MTGAELQIAFRLWAAAAILRPLKRFVPLESLVRLAHREPAGSAAPDFCERLERYMKRTDRFPFRPPANCLERSLGAYRMLCAAGSEPELVIGVRRIAGQGVQGHVWVAVQDRPLAEGIEELETYSIVARFDAKASRDSRLPASGFGLPTSGFRLQAAGFRLPASGCRLQASGFRLQASGFGLRASGFGLPASGSRLPTPGSETSGSRKPEAGSRKPQPWSRLTARLLRATTVIDWAYRRFDRLRALLVTAYASDETLAAYNDLAYAATPVYNASDSQFRERLFNWEEDAIARVFPRAPARVLVGGAGGGREAFQLAARGYEVTAFEPSERLAQSMCDRAAANDNLRVLLGRYETLPVLRTLRSGEAVDLSAMPRFDASMLGWSSYSHIRDPRARIATLRKFADLTEGPVLVSFFSLPPAGKLRKGRGRRLLDSLGRRTAGDAFTTPIGFYHLSSPEEIRAEAAAADLSIVAESFDDSDGHWPWVAVSRVSPPPSE